MPANHGAHNQHATLAAIRAIVDRHQTVEPLTIRCPCGWQTTDDPELALEARREHMAMHGEKRRPRPTGLGTWVRTNPEHRAEAQVEADKRAEGWHAVEARRGEA